MEKWQTLFLTANGRIGQKDFWISILIMIVAGIVLGVIFGMIPLLGMLAQLALMYVGVCVTAKRLHDFGKTGWLAAIPYGISAVVILLGARATGALAFGATTGSAAAVGSGLAFAGMMATIGLLGWLVCLAFLLWVGLTKGDPAPNQYGAPTPSVFDSNTTATPVGAFRPPRPARRPPLGDARSPRGRETS